MAPSVREGRELKQTGIDHGRCRADAHLDTESAACSASCLMLPAMRLRICRFCTKRPNLEVLLRGKSPLWDDAPSSSAGSFPSVHGVAPARLRWALQPAPG